jgi:hypothetical protein
MHHQNGELTIIKFHKEKGGLKELIPQLNYNSAIGIL